MTFFRLISYFLYNNPYLKEVTDLSPTPPIHIRNGVCVDYLGHIPTALMHSYEEAVPISKTCFHLIASTIPPRLLLAAFNVSLVGITTSLIESLPHVQGDRIQASYRTTQLHVPDEVMSLVTQSDNSMMSMRHPIQLHYEMNESSLHLLPCNCLGIISDFDLQQSIVHIITPEDLLTPEISPSGKVSLLHLLRGPMQLPSSLMYNISGQVCAPYLCRENFGEGSTALYARTNMKRRSHGK